MLQKLDQSLGNVVGYKAVGTIDAADYQQLAPEIRALVDQYQGLFLLLDLTECHGEEPGAWLPDLKLGHEFHEDIKKMAIVGDKRWHQWVAHLARPFYAKEARYFSHDDEVEAWSWLHETA